MDLIRQQGLKPGSSGKNIEQDFHIMCESFFVSLEDFFTKNIKRG